ncbi:MAG: sensor histidine kinase [Spirochaeta sp.]|jgi:two-component sensor histidine kinase|nr:sensor histidine kinase [Spirochaeta sp.]
MTVRTEKKYYTAAEVVRSFCCARTCTIHIYTTPGDGFPEFVVAGAGDRRAGDGPAAGGAHGAASRDTRTLHGLVTAAENALDRYATERDILEPASSVAVVPVDGDSPPASTVVAPIDDADSGERLGHLFVTGAADPAGAADELSAEHALASEAATHLIRHIGLSIVHDRTLLRVHHDDEDARIRLREANHRMKNALQTVESLLSLQAGTHDEGPIRGVLREAAQRVRTIQILYDRLSGRDGADGVALSLQLYLTTLVESLQDVYRITRPVTWNVNVEDISLPAEHLSSIGLIFNEVISNALIHGFAPGHHPGGDGSDGSSGRSVPTDPTIHVTATPEGSRLILRVTDNGVGVPHGFEPGEAAGLGTTIVRLLTERLGGTLNYQRREGTTVSIAIPLDHAHDHAHA